MIKSIYNLLPTDVPGFDSLAELAIDLRWSWNHSTDQVWRDLEPALWDLTNNPWAVLQTVSREKLKNKLADPIFKKKVDDLTEARKQLSESPIWFKQEYPHTTLTSIAYFSMEFMLSEALPIYSGGLGNVAGDQLKAASDLGVPVVGIGLLYQQGYFRQVLDKNGEQLAFYPYNDPVQLPIIPVRRSDGELLRLEIDFPGYSLWIRAWQVKVGRVQLYLLDSNDPANMLAHRNITSELYGGGPEQRLKQEILLGIGGWRLLQELNIHPEVCHLNEGHAGFAILERARSFMNKTGQSFDVALAVTRAGNLFTTHTAVASGFDRFDPSLIKQYLGAYAEKKLGITLNDLLSMGRKNPENESEKFNMAFLAIRGIGAINGVSSLHEQVSRKLFSSLFKHWPIIEIPIGHVTNGVHTPSWDSQLADMLWTDKCGKDRWLWSTENLVHNIREISNAKLWKLRKDSRLTIVEYVRDRLSKQLVVAGASEKEIKEAKLLFDPSILTLGFARRFAAYKRPNLLLHDPERLIRILKNKKCPVQLIIAGKAHPDDEQGQKLIQQWIYFIQRPEVHGHVIFLSDYDMHLTEHLVQGVDLWINTPRRPWEACGTSGMKVLVNGGLNLSELDGWWAEAYVPEVGWALGDGLEHGEDPALDAVEANTLYDLLEHEVVPCYYERDENNIPIEWVARMRESMARLTPIYSANRSVREYTEKYYLPSAVLYHEREANQGLIGKDIVEWQQKLKNNWNLITFGEMKVEKHTDQYIFQCQIYIHNLATENIKIELYADGIKNEIIFQQEMKIIHQADGDDGFYVYKGIVPANRPSSDYTARAIACRKGIMIPLENSYILWQK